MLVKAGTYQHGKLTHLPFILNKSTGNTYILLHITVITGHDIMQGVILIFQSTGKSGRSKETVIHITNIHTTGNPGQIISLTISIQVLLSPIVTVSVCMLHRAVKRYFMLIFTPEQVIAGTSTIDDMLGLFCYVGLMGLQIKLIATASELVGCMIFQIDATEVRRTIVSTETKGIHVQLTEFGEAVIVTVIGITVAIAFIQGNTIGIIFSNQGDITAHILLPRLSVHARKHTGNLEGITDRVFGDNIDSTSHCIRSEQGRPTTTYNFYPLYHIYRNLLQSIHAAKGTNDRTTINQNLRIRTFQTIDTHLGKTTILTIVLYTQAGLVIQSLCQVGGVHHLKKFGTHHIHHNRGILPAHFIAIGRYNHFISHEAFLRHREVHNCGKILTDSHFSFLCLITYS